MSKENERVGHSGWGVAAFVVALIVAGSSAFIVFQIEDFGRNQTSFFCRGVVCAAMAGLGVALGIAGLVQRDRKRLLAGLSIAIIFLSSLVAGFYFLLVLFILSAMH